MMRCRGPRTNGAAYDGPGARGLTFEAADGEVVDAAPGSGPGCTFAAWWAAYFEPGAPDSGTSSCSLRMAAASESSLWLMARWRSCVELGLELGEWCECNARIL